MQIQTPSVDWPSKQHRSVKCRFRCYSTATATGNQTQLSHFKALRLSSWDQLSILFCIPHCYQTSLIHSCSPQAISKDVRAIQLSNLIVSCLNHFSRLSSNSDVRKFEQDCKTVFGFNHGHRSRTIPSILDGISVYTSHPPRAHWPPVFHNVLSQNHSSQSTPNACWHSHLRLHAMVSTDWLSSEGPTHFDATVWREHGLFRHEDYAMACAKAPWL